MVFFSIVFSLWYRKKWKYVQCFCEHLNCRLVFNCSAAMISSTTNQGWHKWYGNIEQCNFCIFEEIQIISLWRIKCIWADISHMRIDTFNWVKRLVLNIKMLYLHNQSYATVGFFLCVISIKNVEVQIHVTVLIIHVML